MQISNKGCDIRISLLNRLFWYNSAFMLFPACILPKKQGLTLTVVQSAVPCPAHTAWEHLIFKGPILHFEMRIICLDM